jgi:hypothetical protein
MDYQGFDNGQYKRVSYKYHPYIWGDQDNDKAEIKNLKIKIRWGFVWIFSPFFLSVLNAYIFYQLGILY